MDWENERYVRIYTRDSMTWKLLDWRARTTWLHMLRKLDRAGVLQLDEYTNAEGLAVMLDLPLEVVEPGIEQLIARGTVTRHEGYYFAPNFQAAQEASSSDKQRQKESRAKRADLARAGQLGVTNRDSVVTNRDSAVTERAETVTPSLAEPASPSRPSRSRERQKSKTGAAPSPDAQGAPAGGPAEAARRALVAKYGEEAADHALEKFEADAAKKGKTFRNREAALAAWYRRELEYLDAKSVKAPKPEKKARQEKAKNPREPKIKPSSVDSSWVPPFVKLPESVIASPPTGEWATPHRENGFVVFRGREFVAHVGSGGARTPEEERLFFRIIDARRGLPAGRYEIIHLAKESP